MLELLFAGPAYITFWRIVIQTFWQLCMQPPSLMNPLLKVGNTAGDPLMKSEAQLRKLCIALTCH